MSNYTEVLNALDYPYFDGGSYLTTKALFRQGNDIKSVVIYKDTGKVTDYVTGKTYKWPEFVSMCSGQLVDGGALLHGIDINDFIVNGKPLLNEQKILDKDCIRNLIPDYSYWVKRGISEETLKLFGGGVSLEGKMKNRYVFPIYNSQKQIVGLTGRDLTNKSELKWKHLNSKTLWVWPAFFNIKELQEKREIILVESPGCTLSLFEAGIRNCLCLFGIKLSPAIISFLIKLDPLNIYISLNNDKISQIGNEASRNVCSQLRSYFDLERIQIKLPIKKDFNEMTPDEIRSWKSAPTLKNK